MGAEVEVGFIWVRVSAKMEGDLPRGRLKGDAGLLSDGTRM